MEGKRRLGAAERRIGRGGKASGVMGRARAGLLKTGLKVKSGTLVVHPVED